MTPDERRVVRVALARNGIQPLLDARAALEPLATVAARVVRDHDRDSDAYFIPLTIAQLRAAHAAWRALGGDP